jgi:hypothetical protein
MNLKSHTQMIAVVFFSQMNLNGFKARYIKTLEDNFRYGDVCNMIKSLGVHSSA